MKLQIQIILIALLVSTTMQAQTPLTVAMVTSTDDGTDITSITCLALPLNAVSNVSTSHVNTDYHYEGLLFNIGGRGLLCLSSVTATDSFTGRASTNGTSQWDTQYLVPSKTFSRTTAGSYVSLTEDSLKFTAKPCNNYLATPFRKTETDYYGNVTTTSYTYDADNGTLLTEATTFGGTDTRKSVAYSGLK